jgi:hypothetical protein
MPGKKGFSAEILRYGSMVFKDYSGHQAPIACSTGEVATKDRRISLLLLLLSIVA